MSMNNDLVGSFLVLNDCNGLYFIKFKNVLNNKAVHVVGNSPICLLI